MRILILSFYYQPDLCAGSFRTTALVKSLEAILGDDDEINVITTMPNRYHSYRVDALEYERLGKTVINRIPIPSHKSGMTDQSKAFLSFAQGVRRETRGEQYDVVFATSSRLFTAFLGSLVAKRAGAALYLDIRDIFVDTLQDVLNQSLVTKALLQVIRQIEKYTFRSAKKINLVSKGFEQYFSLIAPQAEYSFFSNGIDDEFISLDFRKKRIKEKAVILYAGNIGEGQGLHKIIPKSAKLLETSCEFWVVGDGGAKEKLEESLRIEEVTNVKIIPPVDREELARLYADSDYLFVHLNDYKAFEKVMPSKIFEYAATGKPLIAGVAGYAAIFIKDRIDNARVFAPCNSQEFVKELECLNQGLTDRSSFTNEFRRESIMNKMARDILMCRS